MLFRSGKVKILSEEELETEEEAPVLEDALEEEEALQETKEEAAIAIEEAAKNV